MFKNLLVFLLVGLFSNNYYAQDSFKYDLNKPYLKHTLPAILNEVSGLTDYDSDHIACVQDELGTVFIYNFRTGKMTSKHNFDGAGDFEGLTYTRKALYILRSDGRLTEWTGFPAKGTLKHYQLPLLTANNEGLCFDEPNNRILIAAKSKPVKASDKSSRFIYAFDLTTKKLSEDPLYNLNTDHLGAKAEAFSIKNNAKTPKGKAKPFNFRPSSLAVHPVSDNIYIISAVDRLMIVINRKGDIVQMEALSQSLFLKAEGITFLKDGTMIITNEAAGRVPDLLVFGMLKK
ncbi:MAG: SdiA-regulated domain-containing protein [Bacteroidia bacterium]|nr:SdiA-regulated domain-containing protein [Bacteroidia bacterium]